MVCSYWPSLEKTTGFNRAMGWAAAGMTDDPELAIWTAAVAAVCKSGMYWTLGKAASSSY